MISRLSRLVIEVMLWGSRLDGLISSARWGTSLCERRTSGARWAAVKGRRRRRRRGMDGWDSSVNSFI